MSYNTIDEDKQLSVSQRYNDIEGVRIISVKRTDWTT